MKFATESGHQISLILVAGMFLILASTLSMNFME